MDETNIKLKGIWFCLHRAVGKLNNTEFLLTKRRQRRTAYSFLIKPIGNNYKLGIINIDKSESNIDPIRVFNECCISKIVICQCKF